MSRNVYKQDPYVQEFSTSINKWIANVEARTLPPLRLKYHDTSKEKECLPSIGQWNMMHKKMVNGGVVKHWACINFSRYVTTNIAHKSCNELALMCRTLGIVFGMNPILTIQGAEPGQRDDANLKVVVLEGDQPLSDVDVEVLNENMIEDEFEETSNATGSTYKHKENPKLSGISEVVLFATSKNKEIVVGPEAVHSDCAVQNEFQNNHTLIEDNEGSKRCGLLETVRCEFATKDDEMDPDRITKTPPEGFGVFVWRAVHDLTLIILAIFVIISPEVRTITEGWKEEWYDDSGITFNIVLVMLWCIPQMEEASAHALPLSTGETPVKQKTKPRCTDQPMAPRMKQTDTSSLWIEQGCRIYIIQDANGRHGKDHVGNFKSITFNQTR